VSMETMIRWVRRFYPQDNFLIIVEYAHCLLFRMVFTFMAGLEDGWVAELLDFLVMGSETTTMRFACC